MKHFLETIWRDSDGFRCISSNPNGEFRNDFLQPKQSLNPDFSRAIESQTDVWFAPAIFNSERRGKDNVKEVRALWLDVDVKDSTYTNAIEATNAVISFVEHYKMPLPTLVKSGNGVHVYWIVESPFTVTEWLEYATALKEACIEFGLKADHSITTDIARILRVPGTKNYKDKTNPKLVQLAGAINSTSKTTLHQVLSPFVLKNKLKTDAQDFNKQFAIDIPQTPKDAELIASKCQQIRDFKESNGNLDEPRWYAGLGVLALCENGESLAHEWSKGHPKYRKKETQAKFERAVEFAPTTCAKFEAVAPDICRACPLFGKITTPVQLGEKVTPVSVAVERPAIDEDKVIEETLPVPRGYEVGREGVFTVASEEENRKMILAQPLWVSRVMLAENGGGAEVEVVWLSPKGRRRSASFLQSKLAKDSIFAEWLLDNGINEYNSPKMVVNYVRAGISTILRKYDEEVIYKNFGLHTSGFVVGEDLITTDGKRKSARLSSVIKRDKLRAMAATGDVKEWSNVTRLFDRPQWWMHRFAILAALGSPLFSLTGTDGSVLSLAGESSGGKTTAAFFGVSAYGSPRSLTVDPKSTLNAFYEHWRQAAHLPIVCNEAATIDRLRLSDIIYAAANGHARDALKQNGEFRDAGTWQTVSIFTSNTHLLALSDKVLGEAERRRIFELSFDVDAILTLDVGQQINEVIKRHHGEAGRLFLSAILPNKDAIAEQIKRRVDDLQRGINSVHRYNIWLIAVVSVTAEIARSLGLIQFGTDDAIKNAILQLSDQNTAQIKTVERVAELIAEYTNEYQANIGAKAEASSGWLTSPHGEALGRYNVNAKGEATVLYLPVKRFKTYAIERNVDTNHIKQYVREHKVETRNQRLAPFAKEVACYVISQEKNQETEKPKL